MIRERLKAAASRLKRGAFLVAALLCLVCGPLWADRWWDLGWKVRRPFLVNPTASGLPGDDAAYAVFVTGQYAKSDGSDIRIVVNNEIVPFKIIYKDPGPFVTVAWKILPNVRTYFAYMDNPKAEPYAANWEPQRGLLLETRFLRQGTPSSLAAMQHMLQVNAEVQGKSFVDRIFFGYNPHGPSINNINVFTGWLGCRAGGTYEFYTSSDDASFLLVDDKLVVQWPGWHNATGQARFKGTTSLTPGLHKLSYLHAQGGDAQIMAAFWKPPGHTGAIEVIPQASFAPLTRAAPGILEQPSGRFLPEFSPSNKGEAVLGEYDDVFLIKMNFENTSPRSAKTLYRTTWDFGDGASSHEISADHVYFASGVYTVKLTMGQGQLEYSFSSPVVVDRDWSHLQTAQKIDTLADYYEIVKDYSLEKMPVRALHNAAWMFEKLDKKDDMVRALQALAATDQKAPDGILEEDTRKLVKCQLERDKAAEASSVLEKSEARAESAVFKARFAVERAAVKILYLDDAAGAKTDLERVLTRYSSADPITLRKAHSLMGDVLARVVTTSAQEAYQAALAEYQKAEDIKAEVKAYGGRNELAVSAISRSLEDYLQRGEFEVAASLLDEWEFRKPTDKIIGYYTLLRADWWLKTGKPRVAVNILQALLEVNPSSPYGDEILWKLADCWAAMRDFEKATDTLNSIAKKFPESPLIEQVPKRLTTIRLPPQAAPPRPIAQKKKT